MRKLLVAAAALGLVTLASPGVARAGVNFSVGIGLPFPPVVVAPAPYPPVVYGPAYYPAPVFYGPTFVPRPVFYGSPYYRVGYHGWGKHHWKHHRGWHD